MAIAIQMAQTTWEGPLASGTGLIRVPGLDKARFDAVAGEASELCPVSRLFAGAKITVDATLEPGP